MVNLDFRPKFFLQPFIGNGDFQYEWNNLERDLKQQTFNQSLKPSFQYFSTLINLGIFFLLLARVNDFYRLDKNLIPSIIVGDIYFAKQIQEYKLFVNNLTCMKALKRHGDFQQQKSKSRSF